VIVQDADFQVTNAVAQAKLAANAKPAAIVALGTPSIKATLASAGNSISIFFGATSDPKALGFSASPDPAAWRAVGAMNGPSNVRGFVTDFDYTKIATLAAETVKSVGPRPAAKVVGYPINESEPNSVLAARQIDAQLAPMGMRVLRAPVAASLETSRATRFLLSKKVGAIQVGPDNMVVGGIGSIVAAAEADHTPVVATDRESVGKGALCAYSVDFDLLGRKLGADIVDTLRGSPPSGPSIRLFSDSKLFYNGAAAAKLPKLKEMVDRLVSGGWTADAVTAQ
jgi:putative ABC transport system substrate-binding protein